MHAVKKNRHGNKANNYDKCIATSWIWRKCQCAWPVSAFNLSIISDTNGSAVVGERELGHHVVKMDNNTGDLSAHTHAHTHIIIYIYTLLRNVNPMHIESMSECKHTVH